MIDMDLFIKDLGRSLTVINRYGPYQDRVQFWEALLSLFLHKALRGYHWR
jgi:hypothetical protein